MMMNRRERFQVAPAAAAPQAFGRVEQILDVQVRRGLDMFETPGDGLAFVAPGGPVLAKG